MCYILWLWYFKFFVVLYSLLVREDREESLICRTNGALERFNRELNHAFPNAHPSISEFVSNSIRRISADKYTQCDRVAKGREKSPVHQPANNLFQLTIPSLMSLQLFEQYHNCDSLLWMNLSANSCYFWIICLHLRFCPYNRYHFAYYIYELYYCFN